MKEKNLKNVIGALTFAGLLGFTTLSFGAELSSFFSPKVARGSTMSISCNCAFFGGNNNCAANNYGAQCAPSGSNHCYAYNGNCEG